MRELRYFIPTRLRRVPTAFLQSLRQLTTKRPFGFWKSIPGRNERREFRALFSLSLTIASTLLSSCPAFGAAANQSIQAGEFQQQRIQAAAGEISVRLDAVIQK